ncbi:hypothetical protein MIND_01104500 [Mycena indigotica]|uniref:F-box domain-containing protein n=1 Tax=Mycena indigotica TaxID=2126181 RepID=A0A8H6SB23_9AGAR|nr:uncharacterized protein MIND_01104500 [Mycena indigotica]KAF7295643.1 hypothetical protein MIND_01104500 [Mycena indigotica]
MNPTIMHKTSVTDVHPITTLPDEIVSEILVRCLAPYPECPPISGPESPTNFLGVCRHWRMIALHSPNLWRGIRLAAHRRHPFGGFSDAIGLKQIDVLKSWLQRSGSCRLSLHLNFLGADDSSTDVYKALFNVVASERHRWEYLFIYIPPVQVQLLSGPVPALVKSTVITNWKTERHVISFDNATLLRSVCFWNVSFGPDSFEWARLTSLSLLNVQATECIPVLAAAINLLQFRLYCSDRLLQNDVQITLPHLETIVLAGNLPPVSTSAESCKWLPSLTLPALRNLEISEHRLGPLGVSCLRAFMARSNCHLEHLRITCIQNEEIGLEAQCRSAFPAIATIRNERLKSEGCSHTEHWRTEEYWVQDSPN